jgi:hypothetical protein
MEKNPKYTPDDVMSHPWATIDERAAGAKALSDFAKATYDALLLDDKKKYRHDFLSMDLWCRLDISVIDSPRTGQLNFFVNEVEKFQSTCIWGRLGGPIHPLEFLACEAAEVLVRYLSQRYR